MVRREAIPPHGAAEASAGEDVQRSEKVGIDVVLIVLHFKPL